MLARERFDELGAQLNELTRRHNVERAVLYWRLGGALRVFSAGAAKPDTVFLLASITKPMTAGAVMLLADRGQIKIEDPAGKYLPEFREGGRAKITIRHLLTHTSGLPDMLPENEELRRRHAPLQDFVRGAIKTPLLFAPGAECRYQSMGILLAAEIVKRVTRQPLPRFLAHEVFGKLGLKATSLGLDGREIRRTAPSQIAGSSDWDWNSPYWRGLGAPWGGAFAPAQDVAAFLRAFLHPEEQRVWKPETAQRMITNQNAGLDKAWGLGWAVNSRESGGPFGKGCSARAFGHSGSTGTLAWADPARDATLVMLTGRPAAEIGKTVIGPLSDAASTSA